MVTIKATTALLAAALLHATSVTAADVPGVTADRILIGQTAGFTGTVAGGVKETTDGARLYINWVMSKYGQQLLTELGDYAARPDVTAPLVMGVQLPPLASVNRPSVEDAVSKAAEDQAVWYKIFNYKP